MAEHIGQTGKIISGPNSGYSIEIQDDSKESGGYFIVGWQENPKDGFDYWVEKREYLDEFFEEAGWKIEWTV
jgi:hypothetical protein